MNPHKIATTAPTEPMELIAQPIEIASTLTRSNQRSPFFSDGYDINTEREALKDLSENPDPADPRWPRFVELQEREEELTQMQRRLEARAAAEPVVPDPEARGIREVGRLVSEEQDRMTLHTKEAYRLFIGKVNTGGKSFAIAGGKRVASALRSIYYLSSNDNPYADWVLVSFQQGLDELRQLIAQETAAKMKLLNELRQRGLSYSVLRADPPKDVEIGFKSPYGYGVAEMLVAFDYYVRLAKTLVRKDLLSDQDGYDAVRKVARVARALFWQPVSFERYLMRKELQPLSRADWLPGANELAAQRVRAVVAIFGEVPRAVFSGAEAPRHSRRRVNLSAEELRLLETIALNPVSVDTADDTAINQLV
ncbi:MAG: TIGR03761 family integrating conjugative element protein [Pseudomonadota bacterium]